MGVVIVLLIETLHFKTQKRYRLFRFLCFYSTTPIAEIKSQNLKGGQARYLSFLVISYYQLSMSLTQTIQVMLKR